MDELFLRFYGDAVLKRKSGEIKGMSKDIKRLIHSMSKLMYANKGIGLAAPQVGILKRVIIADIGGGLVSFVNPKILWKQGKEVMSEGCLSFPGINLDIKRAKEIIIEGIDKKGKSVQIGLQGLLARVIQHEIDHLNGILISDRVSKKRLKPVRNQFQDIKNRKFKSKGGN